MLTLNMVSIIIAICNISALEDTKGKWTELPNVEKYRRECRIYYYDCVSKLKTIPQCDKEKK